MLASPIVLLLATLLPKLSSVITILLLSTPLTTSSLIRMVTQLSLLITFLEKLVNSPLV